MTKSRSSRKLGEVSQADLDFMVGSFGALSAVLQEKECDCFGPGGLEFVQTLTKLIFERCLEVRRRNAALSDGFSPVDEGGQSE